MFDAGCPLCRDVKEKPTVREMESEQTNYGMKEGEATRCEFADGALEFGTGGKIGPIPAIRVVRACGSQVLRSGNHGSALEICGLGDRARGCTRWVRS
jgi:hypothetical protein